MSRCVPFVAPLSESRRSPSDSDYGSNQFGHFRPPCPDPDSRGNQRAVTDDLQAITGNYAGIVTTVASTLAAAGEQLRAGDVIITGSVIPPVPLVEGREFAFALEPHEPIAIRVK